MDYNPIICAIDDYDQRSVNMKLDTLRGELSFIKLGMEFFYTNGQEGVISIMREYDYKIFLDLKLHDIPQTVYRGFARILQLRPAMTTMHLLGGSDMCRRAVEARNEVQSYLPTEDKTLMLGVTVLTSHNDIRQIGINKPIDEQVYFLAENAINDGLDGIVCSPLELVELRKRFDKQLKYIVPGVREQGDAQNDQARTLSPEQAIKAGADYLVIGRPILKADNPVLKTRAILETIRNIYDN